MNVYEIGQVVRLRAAFTNQDGAAVDPGALSLKIKSPLGVETTYVYGTDVEVVKESDGNYYADVEPDHQGVYDAKWIGTGSNKGSKKHRFQVAEDHFD